MGNTLGDGLTALADVFTWISTNFPIVFVIFIATLALGVVLRVGKRVAR